MKKQDNVSLDQFNEKIPSIAKKVYPYIDQIIMVQAKIKHFEDHCIDDTGESYKEGVSDLKKSLDFYVDLILSTIRESI